MRSFRSLAARAARLVLFAAAALAGMAYGDTVALNPSMDNTIYGDQYYAPADNYSDGIGPYFSCGMTKLPGIRRALIAFDTTGIPVGSTINSVTLTLYLGASDPNATTINVSLYKLTTNWGEAGSYGPGDYDDDGEGDLDWDGDGDGGGGPAQPGDATWSYNFYQTQMWNNPGGDFVATASATTPVNVYNQTMAAPNYYNWSGAGLVADVTAWVNNPDANCGWIILGDEVDVAAAVDFDSRENTVTDTIPVLTIDYTPPVGPGVIAFNSTTFQIEPLTSGGQPNSLSITVLRSGGVTGAVSAGVTVSGGSLNDGTDYSFNTPVSFADSVSVATVNVQLGSLTAVQLPGTINLTLANPTGGAMLGAQTSAAITVASAGALAFNAATYQFDPLNIGHNPNDLAVALTRGGGTAGNVFVTATPTGGTLVSGTDYMITNPVAFADGATTANLQIQLSNLDPSQLPGTIELTLTNPTGDSALGAQTTATVTILSPGSVQFTAATYGFDPTDANGNGLLLSVPLERDGGSAGFILADVIVAGGTLNEGTDFTFSPGSQIGFTDGTASGTLGIQAGDDQPQGTIELEIDYVTNDGAVGNQATTTVTFGAPGFAAFDAPTYWIDENATGDAMLTVTVDRVGGSTGAVTVDVAVSSGTAAAGTDYTLPSNPVTLSWADGDGSSKTVAITIPPGALPTNSAESKTLILQLQNATGSLGLLAPMATTVNISGDDSIPPTQTVAVPAANAHYVANSVTFSGEAKDNVRVDHVSVTINGGTAQILTPTSATADYKWTLLTTPEQGASTVVVQAFDGQGNPSSVVTRHFTFANLRPALAGNYHGLITAASAGASAPFNSNGLLSVSVTSTGSFTGRATLSGESYALSGVFLDDGAARFGSKLTSTLPLMKPAKPTGTLLGELSLTLDTGAGHVITGALTDATGATTLATIPHADQALYTSAKKPVAPMINVPLNLRNPALENGKYTVVFQPEPAPNNGFAAGAFPQGIGYATLTVSSSGGVTITGKLPDGSAVSCSNYLSLANTLPVYVSLYANTGFLTGNVVFDPTQTQTDASDIGMLWLKPSALAKQIYYPGGWPAGIAVDLLAAKYLVPTKPTAHDPSPPNPYTVLGIDGALSTSMANIAIALADGDLPANTSNQASLDPNSRITVLGATTGQTGAAGLKPVFASSTGLLTGSFTHPLTNAAVSFYGITFQKTSSAEGYFLVVPPKTAPSGTLSASGSVAVTPIP